MEARKLLDALTIAERLKDTTRHCFTSTGRHESVAEHSWMMTLIAFFIKDEFPEADMDKVIRMCIIHDLGECFTGDIPTFEKTVANEVTEETLLNNWLVSLPENYASEMKALYEEMAERQTVEAKIYKAIDSLEALIQHNLSDISTWIPREYDLNMTYADDKVAFSDYLKFLREEIRKDTIQKIEEAAEGFSSKEEAEKKYEFLDMTEFIRIDRIMHMERCFDELLEAKRLGGKDFLSNSKLQKKYEMLVDYYENGLWLQDYESDERGELPEDLKRGVLSQDAVYDLLSEIKQANADDIRMLKDSVANEAVLK